MQKSRGSLTVESDHRYSSAHMALGTEVQQPPGPPSQSTALSLASSLSALAHLLLQPHSNHKTSMLFLKPARQVLAVLSAWNAPPSQLPSSLPSGLSWMLWYQALASSLQE